MLVAVVLARAFDDLVVGEVPRRLANQSLLVAQFKVHIRARYTLPYVAAMAPETRYARSGDIHIAYQVVGDGPVDLLWVPTLDLADRARLGSALVARMFRRLASFARLIMFDRRGCGMSDRIAGAPTLEEQMDDVVAVMDAAGSERAALFAHARGRRDGAPVRRHPSRADDRRSSCTRRPRG